VARHRCTRRSHKDDFETAVSDTEISQAEFIRLRTIDNGISISGVIAYHDAVGDQYETVARQSGWECGDKEDGFETVAAR